MNVESLTLALGLYAGAFAVGAISSVLPLISIEVFLLLVAAKAGLGGAALAAIVLLATLGQVLGKLPIYFAARGMAALPGRQRAWVDRFRGWVARFGDRPLVLVAASAFVGLPPFSLCSTAAGALAIDVYAFSIVIAGARAARFAVLVAVARHA